MSIPSQGSTILYGRPVAANATTKSWIVRPGVDGITRIFFHIVFGAVTGTLTVFMSSDPRAGEEMSDGTNHSADWLEITASITMIGTGNPVGSAGATGINVSDIGAEFVKLTYTHSSGTAAMRVYYSAAGH
jgi:hypothetical protein